MKIEEIENTNKKKISIMILGICVLALSVVGLTYAFWMLKFSQTEEDKLSSSCFHVTFSEEEQSAIRIEKAYPILDEEGVTLQPYTFTITNTCNENAGYQINLESLSKSGEITIPENDRLKAKYVKLKINEENQEGSISILGDNDVVKTTLKDAYDSHKLITGYLGPTGTENASKTFELRLWLDGALTMEDTEAMNKTFASKITVTASYLKEELIPSTVDLELAVCENTITATGSGKANGEKQITQYEFKIDGKDWVSTENVPTTSFSNVEKGNHVVRLKVTDEKGATSEVSKNIEVGKTINIYGRDIPVTTCNSGLYEVTHGDEVSGTLNDAGFKQTEYRFAGASPNNYVTFNDEKWRIIGLVNVMTDEAHNVEQRIKIVKDEKLSQDMKWNSNYTNDWTKSSLRNFLNEGDYNNNLLEDSKMMIDKVYWNLAGLPSAGISTLEFYKGERGTTTTEEHKVSWNDLIGLIYPSDYGYATSGGESISRTSCLNTSLYSWDCGNNDWLNLKESGTIMWTLTEYTSQSAIAFFVRLIGQNVGNGSVTNPYNIWPTLYLKSNVKIVNNEKDGSKEHPYDLIQIN